MVTDKDAASKSVCNCSTLLQVPYFTRKHLIVAAALTGGNAVAHFVRQLQSWCSELGVPAPSKDSIYQSLFESARKIDSTSLRINPLLWGERHLPSGHGAVLDLDSCNSSLGDITHAVCRGIVTNIKEMMPSEVFTASKVCGLIYNYNHGTYGPVKTGHMVESTMTLDFWLLYVHMTL